MSEIDSSPKKRFKFTLAEKSWMLYDWANSVYATNIMAAIFPIYFVAVAGNAGDRMWALGSSIATLVVALLAPILGAIADYRGMKKKFLVAFIAIGTSFTLLMALTDNWKLMLLGYIVSYIGFTGANLFYDSFLTDVTTKDRMDKVSSYGFALGYVGGSTIAFLISLAFMFVLGLDNPLGVKIAVIITVVWWAVFSLPIILKVKQIHFIMDRPKDLIFESLKSVVKTFRSIISHKGVFVFIIAYFFYIDGVNTVIHMATAYGKTLGLDTMGMIIALLVTQIVAVPCTILFGILSKRHGSLRMILFAVCMYAVICAVGFYMGFSIESAPETGIAHDQAVQVSQILFFIMAILVGTVQGGIQALSRSYFGKLIPAERSNEYFGFFDIFGKFAAVLGPFLYAAVSSATGSAASGIAGVAGLFVIAFIVLIAGRKIMKEAEQSGGIGGEN
ncbi:MAG: MFS transporter [Oscillospiraceae bacterium]|nr:MFS transporter [Oscillospiraceae bacterium]